MNRPLTLQIPRPILSSKLVWLAITSLGALTSIVYYTSVLTQPAAAITPPDSCFAFNAGTGTITDYYDHEGDNSANPACPRDVDIPSTIGGVPVTAIGPSAFQSKQLTAVTVPGGVTTIGGSAFRDNVIESVSLPNSVTSIGAWAFYINKLTEIDIPDNLTGLSSAVFRSNKLTDVVLPAGITTIGSYAFENNPISSINIPHGVTSIGGLAFSGGNLTEIELPDTLTFIGERAFRYNDFTTITIPSSVNHMDWGVFYGNYNLQEAIFEGDVADIANDTFQFSSSLQIITYDGVQYPTSGQVTDNEVCFKFNATNGTITGIDRVNLNIIKDQGESCLSRDISIPASIGGVAVTSIGSYSLYNQDLNSVVLPSSLLSIGDNAFYSNELTHIHLGSDVQSIGANAFAYNQLTSVDIPDAVSSIGATAFGYNQLTSFEWPSGLDSMPDYVFRNNQLTTVAIPNNVTSIGTGAFWFNNITSLQLHGGISYIGNSAFRDNELQTLVIPEGITSTGMLAFARNYLEEVSLPQTLQTIGEGAFQLNSIAEIVLPSSVSVMEHSAFSHQSPYSRTIIDDLAAATNPAAAQEILDSIFYTRVILEDTTNPNNLKTEVNYRLDAPDYNQNGNLAESINFGGYIINPAALQLNYHDKSNHNILNRVLFAGMLDEGAYIHSYRVSEGPVVPAPIDRLNPTQQELAAIDQAMTAYFRVGDTVTIAPPDIDGYQTPQAQTYTLAQAFNEAAVVYASAPAGGGQVNAGDGGRLADTGMAARDVAIAALALIGGALSVLIRLRL